MKSMIKIFVVISATFFLFLPTAFASSAPQGVNVVIKSMDEFEKSFGDYEWLEASVAVATIQQELKQIFAVSQLNDASLHDAVKTLMRSVVKKSEEETVVNFDRFQKKFYTYINHFE